MDDEMQPF
jgi:chromosome segregation ATPase